VLYAFHSSAEFPAIRASFNLNQEIGPNFATSQDLVKEEAVLISASSFVGLGNKVWQLVSLTKAGGPAAVWGIDQPDHLIAK
jgi:hypothetical protein